MLIDTLEFKKRLDKTGIKSTFPTIIKYIKEKGGKKISGKWYCEESVFEKFINGE